MKLLLASLVKCQTAPGAPACWQQQENLAARFAVVLELPLLLLLARLVV
jgi:hypothetical protein